MFGMDQLKSRQVELLGKSTLLNDQLKELEARSSENGGTWPEERKKRHRDIKAEFGRNKADLEVVEARIAEVAEQARRAENAADAVFSVSVSGRGGGDPWAAEVRSDDDARAVARSCIERVDLVDDDALEVLTGQLDDGEKGSGLLARWSIAASDPNYQSAYVKMLVDPNTASVRMTDDERSALHRGLELQRSMTVGTPSGGGYMVPFTLDPAILLTSAGVADSMATIARTVHITTDKWHGVSSAGVTSSWDAELEEVSDDSPTLAQPTIPVHGLRTFVPFSLEAEMDIASLINDLQVIIRDDQSVKESTAFWTGNGTSQPRGIITALDAAAGSEVATGTADTFVVGDVYKLHEALPARFRNSGAVFSANIQVLNRCRQFATGTGQQHAFLADLAAGQPPQMLGHRTFEASPMEPFDGSGAENILAFFDPSRYVIVRRVGTTAEVVPHLFGANGRPVGQRGIFVYARTGGDFPTPNAGRLLQS